MYTLDSLGRRLAELQSEIVHFRVQLAKIPPGSTRPDDQITKRIFDGLIRSRRAELARLRRRLAGMGQETEEQRVTVTVDSVIRS